MTSDQIRQSFFSFFAEKQHTVVASASLLPQSPGLLFTNAGMNQFVPYFLGTEKAPYSPARAADTQKCIRAGGKHNDLEDVGYDSYHHTFFEMLGNWSFGDYFKEEAIAWAWELLVHVWKFPPERLYATVYRPAEGDPGEFDEKAHALWSKLFVEAGLDPAIHVVDGNVKDNFWMMGETGPCGPCSELHIDLTEKGDTKGALVNADSDRCIEIWNLVFIQYNAEADGSFRPLPACHVDTGMGFERVCSVLQTTKGLTDFSSRPSNYATDVFSPLFAKLAELSGKQYGDLYPEEGLNLSQFSEELKRDVALRVIADHIRTLSLAIADGILPGNTGRNYVLRRILRRAVRYGRQLGFDGRKPFLPELVEVLVLQLGEVFPELKEKKAVIIDTLCREETSFNETLDRGLQRLEAEAQQVENQQLSGEFAFQLYDTFGFPVDLTQLLARERGLTVDMEQFEVLMEQQRQRARKAGKTTLVKALEFSSEVVTEFVGYEQHSLETKIVEVHEQEELCFVITAASPFYAEMGGQQGDVGTLIVGQEVLPVVEVQQVGAALAHVIEKQQGIRLEAGQVVRLEIDGKRRHKLEANHSATHLLHWALHEEVSKQASQQGSLVAENRLRFDFSSSALSASQLEAIELRVNKAIAAAEAIYMQEVAYAKVKENPNVLQFFGDKYGEVVRVVQMGGSLGEFNGFSMELCGGTHLNNTAEIGLFKLKSEGAIASGVRRIEALTGKEACKWWQETALQTLQEAKQLEQRLVELNAQLEQLGEKGFVETLRVQDVEKIGNTEVDFAEQNQLWQQLQQELAKLRQAILAAEKKRKKVDAARAEQEAESTLTQLLEAHKDGALVLSKQGESALLQHVLNGLKKRQFPFAAVCVVDDGNRLHVGVHCGVKAQESGLKAGELVAQFTKIAGGKGGGQALQARGAAPDRAKQTELLAFAEQTLL